MLQKISFYGYKNVKYKRIPLFIPKLIITGICFHAQVLDENGNCMRFSDLACKFAITSDSQTNKDYVFSFTGNLGKWGIVYTRGGQPVAHWLLKSGALHRFDDKPLLLTNFFFFYLPSTNSFQEKTENVRAEDLFFIFYSPPTLSVENRSSKGIGARRGATVPCPPPFGPVIWC